MSNNSELSYYLVYYKLTCGMWVKLSIAIAILNDLYIFVGVVDGAGLRWQRKEGNQGGLPLQELHN